MENKSKLKYYLLGLIVLIIVVVIILLGNSKSASQQSQATSAANISTASTPNSTSTSELIGTWVSAVSGKGMQGLGKITFSGTAYQIGFTGDINLVIEKVENNLGTGTITFSNLCLTTDAKPAQCIKTYSQPAVMQISGNTINYTGPTMLGASLSLSGTYTNDSISGTFTRTSSSGKINGTFNLARTKS